MIKRMFDIYFSFFGLVIFSPLLFLLALLIKINMPDGPVIFKQKRVGRHGKLFTIYKFRTMTMNHSGSSITISGESRITPLGAKLRKYKLDELPELWNVLVGEMSFVGPRPDVPGFADKLTGEERKILEIRPGITGPASLKYVNEEELLARQNDPIRYNNEVIYPDKVRINLSYISNWSLWLDIKIIIYTLIGGLLKEDHLS